MEERKKGWWDTKIIDLQQNKITISGYRIQDLMGRVSYGEMLYLLTMGRLPDAITGKLIEAVLVAVCDQGVVSPAIATSRMAATCGITFNSVIASGMNLLGTIHGGAVEGAMEVFYDVVGRAEKENRSIKELASALCLRYKEEKRYMPGYGHPLHTEDPRTPRLWALAGFAQEQGKISGKYVVAAQSIHEAMKELTGKSLTINIDASAGAVLCELGIMPQVASGIISLSRGLGLLAHAHEEAQSGKRIKAPMPPDLLKDHMTYSGPKERELSAERMKLP